MTAHEMGPQLDVIARLELALGRSPHLGTVMERLAKAFGDKRLVEQPADPKVGVDAVRLTFNQGARRVEHAAARIAAATEPGSTVVIRTPNGYDQFLLCLAAARAGCVAAPVNDQMRQSEIDHVVEDAGASLVISSEDELPPPGDTPPTPTSDPGDLAALFYTSGTTGRSKGARLTHRALAGGVRGIGLPPILGSEEAVLGLPVAHIYGFLAYLSLAGMGVPAYGLPRFRPVEVLDAIESRRAAIFLGVPSMYRMLLEAGAENRDLRCVRVWISGADVMPDDLAARFQKMGAVAELPLVGKIGRALFVEGYGMVELGGGVAIRLRPPVPTGGGSYLRPLPGWEVKIDADNGDVGELLVRGPGVMQGYHNAPEATAAVLEDDGWVRTGDLVRSGPLGSIIFEGRAKDVVKHGGYSVYAPEVERVIEEHPAVAEAALVGITDERKGEVPAVVVRLNEGQSVTEDELLGFAGEHLSDYKTPTRVAFVDEMPKTASQKIQKGELKKLFD